MMYSAGWKSYRLSDIAEIDKSAVQPSEILKGTTFVGLENISESGSVDTTRTVSSGELLSTKFRFTNKHILYGKLRPYLKKIARPACDGICSTDILPILPKETVDRDFLYYFLRQPQLIKLATERSIGANLPRLSPATLAEFEIAVPPIPIQKQIAAILEKADAAREKRRQANQLTEQFLQSAFLDMFGDPVTNPKGWDRLPMEEVCSKVADGTHFSPPPQKQGIPYITAKNVKKHGLDFDLAPTYVSEEHHREIYRRCDPLPGDVIYIKDGVTTGIAAVNRYDFEFSMLSSLALLRPKPEILKAEYLSAYLNAPSAKSVILRQMSGGAIKRLTVAKIKKLTVVAPEVALQEKFALVVQKLESLREKQKESGKELENLFNGLMQKAFKGELVG